MSRTHLATLPGSAPLERLQVALEQGDGGPLTFVLTEEHYAEGLGWFTQRSFRLDTRQWAQLQAVLGSRATAGTSGTPMPTPAPERDEAPAILPFPGPGSPRPIRPAIGDGSE